MSESECRHGLEEAWCAICQQRDETAKPHKRDSGTPTTLDSPEAVERYRDRYPGDREATFEAYVEVYFGNARARAFPGGWTKFSRCANAEPALARDESQLVSRAEELMRDAGYELDDSDRRRGGGRKWRRLHG